MISSKNKSARCLLICCFFFLTSLSSLLKAQDTGKIKGTVVDSNTGETLIGVNVVIQGTTKGDATDIDGVYTISNVAPGTYTLVLSYISYNKKIIEGVEVIAGETTIMDVPLSPDTEELEEVVVSARSIQNNEAALLSKRQKSVAFSDAISAESISRTGAGNAASAMKKVVGASVVDGKYVFVRGLGDRYTGTQLNGSNLPSADPDRKSFQMDLFPSNLLENITTSKTFTPDKPGNFTGGLVDVSTKDFPDQFNMSVSFSSEYNTRSTFQNILQGPDSGTDVLGFDNGKRAMPDIIRDFVTDPSRDIPTRIEARRDEEAAALLDDLSRSFNNVMEASNDEVPTNQSFSFSIGDLIQIGGKDFGYNASISYSQSFEAYDDGTEARWELFGNDPQAVDSLQPELNTTDMRGDRNVDLGGLLNLSYRLSPNHKISSTLIRTQSATNTGRILQGSNPEEIGNPDPVFTSRVTRFIERSLNSFQLKGKSYFPDLLESTVEWNGSYSKNNQEEPDLRFFQSETRIREFAGGVIDTSTTVNTSGGRIPPARFFRDLDEDNYNFNVNISIPFETHTSQRGNIKFGGTVDNSDREFREFRLEYDLANSGLLSFDDVGGNSADFFDFAGIVDTDENGNIQLGHVIDDRTERRNNYDGDREIKAVYGMVETPVTERLKFIGGLRVEDTFIETVSQDTSEAIGKLDDTDFLPSVNFIYSLTDRMNVRTAVTRTLARPTFRELAPFISFDFVGDFLFRGSADLERTLIWNYDARWEWFMSPGEVIAVSGFYKKFDDPLERAISLDFGNNVISIQNVDNATVYGMEFELRKRLDFITPFFENFLVSTNFSLIESEVDIPKIELFEIIPELDNEQPVAVQDSIIAAAPDNLTTRDLNGQSPFTFNFDLAYQNPKIGFNASANYNIFGDRLETVRRGLTPNIFERSYGSLNLVANKNIGERLLIKMSASNLLNPNIETSQRFKGVDFVNTSRKIGRSFQLGISYNL